jgi:hypothetical protein
VGVLSTAVSSRARNAGLVLVLSTNRQGRCMSTTALSQGQYHCPGGEGTAASKQEGEDQIKFTPLRHQAVLNSVVKASTGLS